MTYDLIVVGSGNGACGFLAKYVANPLAKSQRILVIEEGRSFFTVSDIAHQRNWIKSFSESNVFKLRNALTEDGTPIITARGCCEGGGGSINYSMIAESSQWLSDHLGRDVAYWDDLKRQMNDLFGLLPPTRTAATQRVFEVASAAGYKINHDTIGYVPNFALNDELSEASDTRLVHHFPTPFNRFGQRTHSGASIIDLAEAGVELRTRTLVTKLKFEKLSELNPARCTAVCTVDLETKQENVLPLSDSGKVVLCAGSVTPQLLLPHKELLGCVDLGANVSDHILIPLGIYLLDDDMPVFDRDFYLPTFLTSEWKGPDGRRQEYCFDFHAGILEALWFIIAHLFLGFVFPNWFKVYLIRWEPLFRLITNVIHGIFRFLTILSWLLGGVFNLLTGKPWITRMKLIVATLKYKPAHTGKYVEGSDRKIELAWFRTDCHGFCQDAQVAKDVIKDNMAMLNTLGTKPPWIVRFLIRLLIGIPYSEKDVDKYVDKYRERYLLSQLHLAGGSPVDRGDTDPHRTGLVIGAENVFVGDLSAVPLPRISPQMTAYLMGFHLATSLCQDKGVYDK